MRAAMFDNLSSGLEKAWDIVRKDGKLTKDNIKGPMREIRRALLEADVSVLASYLDPTSNDVAIENSCRSHSLNMHAVLKSQLSTGCPISARRLDHASPRQDTLMLSVRHACRR